MIEQAPLPGQTKSRTSSTPARTARPVNEVSTEQLARIPTGAAEFDRALGGGLVSGQVVLIAGEPGVGKSTLLLAVSQAFAKGGRTVLYVTGEESIDQIGIRAQRIGALAPTLLVADESDVHGILQLIGHHKPALVIVDSVQTISSADVDGRPGGVAQVLEVTQALTKAAKQRGVPLLLIGQSTRENSVAGPRALEHLVDTLLTFEGDRATSLRLLRTAKNRYGPADEFVCFEQTEAGLREVSDPSELFRGHRDEPVPGTCVTVTMEGRRALLAEIQALVSQSNLPSPRRVVTGMDTTRIITLAAVTEKAGLGGLSQVDIFIATVGGAQIADPAADLAVCLAMASSKRNAPMPADVLAIGEVALSGDVRPVPFLAQRVAEARRLGYQRILVPPGSLPRLDSSLVSGSKITEVSHVSRGLASLERIAKTGH